MPQLIRDSVQLKLASPLVDPPPTPAAARPQLLSFLRLSKSSDFKTLGFLIFSVTFSVTRGKELAKKSITVFLHSEIPTFLLSYFELWNFGLVFGRFDLFSVLIVDIYGVFFCLSEFLGFWNPCGGICAA